MRQPLAAVLGACLSLAVLTEPAPAQEAPIQQTIQAQLDAMAKVNQAQQEKQRAKQLSARHAGKSRWQGDKDQSWSLSRIQALGKNQGENHQPGE